MSLRNKVVLITGGSSGIGEATALRFAQEGSRVVISYKENKSGADSVASKLKHFGANELVIQADLTKDLDAKRLVEQTMDHFRKIDILVNNAGRYINGDEWNGSYKIWEESLRQNLLSTLCVSKYIVEIMQEQKSGVIVNIASRHSVSGQPDATSYAAAKAGIVNITQAYAKLMAPWGRANAVSPGAVRAGYWLKASQSELEENIKTTPVRKLIEPGDIAETILFLASDSSKMITGQNLIVDGGFTLK